jgi:hypothetical protein
MKKQTKINVMYLVCVLLICMSAHEVRTDIAGPISIPHDFLTTKIYYSQGVYNQPWSVTMNTGRMLAFWGMRQLKDTLGWIQSYNTTGCNVNHHSITAIDIPAFKKIKADTQEQCVDLVQADKNVQKGSVSALDEPILQNTALSIQEAVVKPPKSGLKQDTQSIESQGPDADATADSKLISCYSTGNGSTRRNFQQLQQYLNHCGTVNNRYSRPRS